MKFLASLLALPAAAYAVATTLSWDATYDNPNGNLTSVACSNGSNGVINLGFTHFGDLPDFPNIGGIPAIAGFNSPNCGTCWKVTWTPSSGSSRSINILGIDVAPNGFNVAKAAMNQLTNNQADFLGRVNVNAVQVDASACGL